MRSIIKILLLASATLSILAACNKEEEQQPFRMAAGATGTSVLYHDLQPDSAIQPVHYECYGHRDNHTLDLNTDGIADLLVIYEDADGEEICSCFYAAYPDTAIVDCFPRSPRKRRMKTLNDNLQIAAEDSSYFYLVDALEKDALIDDNLQWGSGEYLMLYHTNEMGIIPYGRWKKGTHYMGIRFTEPTDTLYGWVRINADTILTVMDYALER